MIKLKLGIIGCGNMGEAFVKGILAKNIINRNNVYVSDKIKTKVTNLRRKYGVKVQSINSALVKKTEVIILAVKPQDAQQVLEEVRFFIDESKLLISIMAGIRIKKIMNLIGRSIPIARVMPNMAAALGESISAASFNRFVQRRHKEIVGSLTSSIGELIQIDEGMQDAFTAICGSGPAYFFYIVECLAETALKYGFSRKDALSLAVQTLNGSAKVLALSGASPKVLREKVTSKGGTTEAAIEVFKKQRLKKIIINAVSAAVRRSKEISYQSIG